MADVITIIFDRAPGEPFYAETVDAVHHAIDAANASLEVRVERTDELTSTAADALGAGIVIGPGSPFADAAATEAVIRSARERGVPLVDT